MSVGASTAASGVVVDLRRLDEVRADRGSGTAEIGGGARLIDVYKMGILPGIQEFEGFCSAGFMVNRSTGYVCRR